MKSYAGKILEVDLTNGTRSEKKIEEADARKLIGGRGLGAKALFEGLPPGADPLSPANPIIFMTGPFAGTGVAGGGRYIVVSKSPLTGIYGETYSGGHFAHELKYAGYDGIVVTGKADEKVYIAISDGRVEIKRAASLWGKEVKETEEAIRSELQDDYKIASIGPAGEKLVRFSCIMNDLDRAGGRTGLGAVMGSKNLKAIAVRGKNPLAVADGKRLMELSKKHGDLVRNDGWGKSLTAHGTSGGALSLSEIGILPTGNFEDGTFDGAAQISGENMARTILVRNKACMACTIGCTRVVQVSAGPFSGVMPCYGGPEYETVAALGSLCRNSDLESIAMANQICNANGLDTISMGNVIAFTMECIEKGVLKGSDIGFEPRWGDGKAVVRLAGMVAKREGFGDLLAEGVKRAAEKLGGDAPRFAVQVKGLEVPMHEPRGKKGLGISYAVSPRGAVHTEGFHDTAFMWDNLGPELRVVKKMDRFSIEEKPFAVKQLEDFQSATNSLILCMFLVRGTGRKRNIDEIVGMLNAATGWDFTFEELLKAGERNYTLCRAISALEGIRAGDDRLHEKFEKTMKEGASKDHAISPQEMEGALANYYKLRGWTPDGVPSREKLLELKLEEVAARF